MPLDPNNITFRLGLGRKVTYEEVDENFRQVKFIITDYLASFSLFSGWKDDAEDSYQNALGVYNDTTALVGGWGQMAYQEPTSVAITGGTIEGVTISSLTNELEISEGGTNNYTYDDWGVTYYDPNTDQIVSLLPSNENYVFKSGGVGAPPKWVEEDFTGKGADSNTGSVVLDSNSDSIQRVETVSYNQSLTLPDATTIPLASLLYTIVNDGNYTLIIKNDSGAILGFLMGGERTSVGLSDKSTSDGEWVFDNVGIVGVEQGFNLPSGHINYNNDKRTTKINKIDEDRYIVVFSEGVGIKAFIVNITTGNVGVLYELDMGGNNYATGGRFEVYVNDNKDIRVFYDFRVGTKGSCNVSVFDYSGETISDGGSVSRSYSLSATSTPSISDNVTSLLVKDDFVFYSSSFKDVPSGSEEQAYIVVAGKEDIDSSKISNVYVYNTGINNQLVRTKLYDIETTAGRVLLNFRIKSASPEKYVVATATDGFPITVSSTAIKDSPISYSSTETELRLYRTSGNEWLSFGFDNGNKLRFSKISVSGAPVISETVNSFNSGVTTFPSVCFDDAREKCLMSFTITNALSSNHRYIGITIGTGASTGSTAAYEIPWTPTGGGNLKTNSLGFDSISNSFVITRKSDTYYEILYIDKDDVSTLTKRYRFKVDNETIYPFEKNFITQDNDFIHKIDGYNFDLSDFNSRDNFFVSKLEDDKLSYKNVKLRFDEQFDKVNIKADDGSMWASSSSTDVVDYLYKLGRVG